MPHVTQQHSGSCMRPRAGLPSMISCACRCGRSVIAEQVKKLTEWEPCESSGTGRPVFLATRRSLCRSSLRRQLRRAPSKE